ncbi:MAG: transcription antitermination factor NusB [Candidatus Omnitrophica bacterium]|nr:transcription antitermination factor NusB [Candidatus Omnitrophota bacterium]
MRKRTLAREFALQILYQIDITQQDATSACENFWQALEHAPEQEIKTFTEELVLGVSTAKDALDKKISQYAKNWELDRIAVVDRNILRLGGYEILYRSDIPPKVAINEAVELAKKYADIPAAKFVNGILDKFKQERQI